MRRFLTFAILLSLLTGCANIASLLPTPQPVTVPTNTSIPTLTATSTSVSPTVTPGGPRTLRIWVPPQFDPSAGTPAGRLLQERLDEFVARRPGLRIDVRVKAESGTSSLLNALAVTKSAAPPVMPDLVALSRSDLESATAKGLIHPLDGLTDLPEDSDWFPYARQMAHIQNSAFGLPFAADALVMVGFRSPLPTGWTELPEETLYIFPAADPRALFTLSLYLSAGGKLQDTQGQFTLDETRLAEVLALYVPEIENGFISTQVPNYETDEQAWSAFLEQRGNLVVSWASRYLNDETTPLALAPLPGFETGQYSLATGWSWALSSSAPENEALAVELAEFLSDSQFLGEWTQAAGYLPTRPKALSAWEDAALQVVLKQTAESASLLPGDDSLATVGPLFTQAVLSVLSGEQLPSEAARSVIDQLK
jgi:ABC-type glycerol-3-phosphate transport system substrate-binding protein